MRGAAAVSYTHLDVYKRQALAECERQGIAGKAVTPFLLGKVKELTGGDSLEANIQLVLNNARLGAQTAIELAKRK